MVTNAEYIGVIMKNIKNQFDFFRTNDLIYLDSGATTQIPDSVIDTINQHLKYRGNPGRGEHLPSAHNRTVINNARNTIAQFIGCSANEIILTGNTTDSINLSVHAIAHEFNPGDEIIVSIAEHHSNLLPYYKLAQQGIIIKVADLDDGRVSIESIKSLISDKTKLISVSHCSNVLGCINPVEEIGRYIKDYNPEIIYTIDGAQAIAHVPVDVKALHCDFYAFSGHKMYASDGIGVLYINQAIQHRIKPTRIGGATVSSLPLTFESGRVIMSPEFISPTRSMEGGTENISGASALAAAIEFIHLHGWEFIRKHELELTALLLRELQQIPEIIIHGPSDLNNRIGLVSFSLKDGRGQEVADFIIKRNICIRYGSHCAFPLTEKMGRESLRVSIGIYNSADDIHTFINILKEALAQKEVFVPKIKQFTENFYHKKTKLIYSIDDILNSFTHLTPKENTSIVIMGGHFLAIPDVKENTFWPSLKQTLPAHLHHLLDEFGMTTFPAFTWDMACETTNTLKTMGFDCKLSIIANEITGINELRLSSSNNSNKTAVQYRKELLDKFRKNFDIAYMDTLIKYGLTINDLIKCNDDYLFTETHLRKQFKNFISNNKDLFEHSIQYTADKMGHIDLSISILDGEETKSCHFNTFGSKTGGRFCTVEVAQYIAELFGKNNSINYDYVSTRVKQPTIKSEHKILIMLSPALCNNAITHGLELYAKLFLEKGMANRFTLINVPFGPNAEKSLQDGIHMNIISNKDDV